MSTLKSQISMNSLRKRQKRQVGFEASQPWLEWLDTFAESMGMNRSQCLDQAMRRWAKAENYPVLPPMR